MKIYLSAVLLLAGLSLAAPVSYATPAHSEVTSNQTQTTSTNLQFTPVHTSPDWQAAGLSLKRAELSPGVWGYMLTSSRSGQQIMFAITNKDQAKLLWSNTPTKAHGNQSSANQVMKPNANQCPCYIHKRPGVGGNTIVTMTGARGNVIAVWVVDSKGNVTKIFSAG